MSEWVWIAANDAGLNDMAVAQVAQISALLGCPARIWCAPEFESDARERFPGLSVEVLAQLWSPFPDAGIASVVNARLSSLQCVAVLGQHSAWLAQSLSMASAALREPFYSRILLSHAPECVRSICANRACEAVRISGPFMGTVMPGCGQALPGAWQISEAFGSPVGALHLPTEIEFDEFSDNLVSLDRAKVVFAGGRGLGSGENFEKLSRCAARYGAGLAASRLAVDLGWCRNDLQVGQTGRAVAPEIYVAFGISGAIQHLAGIQNARKIYAVNTDKTAPIFEFSDFGLIADAVRVIDRLLEKGGSGA